MGRIILRDRVWRVESSVEVGLNQTLFNLLDVKTGEKLRALAPPEPFEVLPEEGPRFARSALAPFGPWLAAHQALKLLSIPDGEFAALYGGRISPEPYQFRPVAKMLQLPRPSLLVADDVGLGKTVEAGICMTELIARGLGKRILLVVPPGLIPQWQEEMLEKFGLKFESLENAPAVEHAQTRLSEGIKPWVFLNRVITSVEYVKKREVLVNALDPGWDIIVVDEAHYLAESGTPRNPYQTARARLGQHLREHARALLLLTATPHNGYSHSFRSLLEIVEPTDATFRGDKEVIARRVDRNMIRRLKSEIWKTGPGGRMVPAFQPRELVQQITVTGLSDIEREIFTKVSAYCAKTAKAAEQSDDAELVTFAMQIIKKRMLSSRTALLKTVENRLSAIGNRAQQEEPPTRAEIRELKGDLPLSESTQERIASRIVRASISKETRRRNAEKKQLKEIQKLIQRAEATPDPKISALISELEREVFSVPGEKAIIFTEYLDTVSAIREALQAKPELRDSFVELTGGLSAKKRQARIAQFEKPKTRLLLATDAASEGLNLQQFCRRIYHFELPWNPNRMEQRNGRVDRHGQTRSPIIRYLFYPDSPEDQILHKLVQRIIEMQNDRISTPDILGILLGAPINEVLTSVNAEEGTDTTGQSLFRIFEERRDQFAREVAPLLITGDTGIRQEVDPGSLSADSISGDDVEFEAFMVSRLGTRLRPGRIAHTFSLQTPRELLGPNVAESYPCLTFRRSVATQNPARDVEFVTRLHPLFEAIAQEAFEQLTIGGDRRVHASRIAVRRHPLAAGVPYAVFTFLSNEASIRGELLCIAVNASGEIMDNMAASAALDLAVSFGEVQWAEVSTMFEEGFPAMQQAAEEAALVVLKSRAEKTERSRRQLANTLRQDAERYRADRLAEIELEEREAQIAERGQQLLFDRREVYGLKAKRAAIDTFHQKRLAEIGEFENVKAPAAPQPLGAVFIFPPVNVDAA